MPTLNWIGKEKVINHHQEVPFKVLEHRYGFTAEGGEQKEEDGGGNMIIHGDNLEALKSLLPYYEGKVKCIYIDPPYNTGKDSWVYNDNVNHPKIAKWLGAVVGKEEDDLTRHDKWLCMMYPRLKLLHKLLSDDGVIFISINDIENASLRYICDEIFGRRNFLAQLIWNSEGNTDNQLEIKINHEYILLYTKRSEYKERAIGWVIDPNTREDSNLWKGIADNNINKNNPANPPDIIELPAGFACSEEDLFYPKKVVDDDFFKITSVDKYISDEVKEKYGIENQSGLPIKLDDMVVKDHELVKPCRIYGGFANKKKLLKFIQNDLKPIDDNGSPLRFYLNRNAAVRYRKENNTPRNILSVLRNFGTTEKMRTQLKKVGVNFDYPKPVELIKYLIEIGSQARDSLVLDSFSGSGTTAHAVLSLNKQDGGNRKFILIQMTEIDKNGDDVDVCETITAERVKKVIKGYGKGKNASEGTGGNFDYYEIGSPLFKDDDYLNESIGENYIRQYVWYSETRSSFIAPNSSEESRHFLGGKDDTAYYFFYEREQLTTLDYDFLEEVKTKAGQYVIYADNCLLDRMFMQKNNIIFKKIPRDITRF